MHLERAYYSAFVTDEQAAEKFPMALPTRKEAHTLSNVCRRVALRGYRPSSLFSHDELNDDYYASYPVTDDGRDSGQFVSDNDDDQGGFDWNWFGGDDD